MRKLTVLVFSAIILLSFTSCAKKPFSTLSWPEYEIKTTGIYAHFPAEPTIKKASYGMNIILAEATAQGADVKYEIVESMGGMLSLNDWGGLRQYRTKLVRVLRSQIFCQIVQLERRQAGACQAKAVQYDGKSASKTCAKALAALCAVLP